MSWHDHKFDLTERSFFLYSALKWLSKTKLSLEWQREGLLTSVKVIKLGINCSIKDKRFNIKESTFQQYILAQSQHQRHRTGTSTQLIHLYCKSEHRYIYSNSAIKRENKHKDTAPVPLLLSLSKHALCWKLLCFNVTNSPLLNEEWVWLICCFK